MKVNKKLENETSEMLKESFLKIKNYEIGLEEELTRMIEERFFDENIKKKVSVGAHLRNLNEISLNISVIDSVREKVIAWQEYPYLRNAKSIMEDWLAANIESYEESINSHEFSCKKNYICKKCGREYCRNCGDTVIGMTCNNCFHSAGAINERS